MIKPVQTTWKLGQKELAVRIWTHEFSNVLYAMLNHCRFSHALLALPRPLSMGSLREEAYLTPLP
jgi:hypothetical protein